MSNIIASNIRKLTSKLSLGLYKWGAAGSEEMMDSNFEKIDAALNAEKNNVQSLLSRMSDVELFLDQNSVFPDQGTKSHGAVNVLPDSGRFAGTGYNPNNQLLTSSFEASPFFSSFNGSTFSDAGKFINDNTTNGGNNGGLTAEVISLLAAMGDPARRFGVEFYLNKIVAGTGTSSAVNGHFLTLVNASKAIVGARSYVTFGCWIKVNSGSLLILSGQRFLVNGQSHVGNLLLTSADGFIHVEFSRLIAIGYDNAFPRFYATQSTEMIMGLPVHMPGQHFIGMHTAPIPTISSLSS